MKLLLLSDSKTPVKIFPKVKEIVSEKISNLEIEIAYVPFMVDFPQKVLEAEKDFDYIFVFSLYDEETPEIKTVMEKLIEVEIKTGKKIMKILRETDFEGTNKKELKSLSKKLTKKWSFFIIEYIAPEKTAKKAEFEEDPDEFADDEKVFGADDDMFASNDSEYR